jgi:hypothetical protein
MPRTMRGKAVLKRIFYGRLELIPPRVESMGPGERMLPAEDAGDLTRYRNLYFEGRKAAS